MMEEFEKWFDDNRPKGSSLEMSPDELYDFCLRCIEKHKQLNCLTMTWNTNLPPIRAEGERGCQE